MGSDVDHGVFITIIPLKPLKDFKSRKHNCATRRGNSREYSLIAISCGNQSNERLEYEGGVRTDINRLAYDCGVVGEVLQSDNASSSSSRCNSVLGNFS